MKKSRYSDSQILAILKQNEVGISVADLCREHGMSNACFYQWRSKFGGMDASLMKRMKELEDENRRLKKMYAEEKLKAEIADWLLRLTTTHRRWGFGLCFLYLRNIQGYPWNHKRVYRIYRELELNLRIKPRRRVKRDKPDALSVPEAINQVWSMDFMSDTLIDGRSIRTFNVIDDFNREGLTIDVDLSLPSTRVIRSLDQLIEWRGKPFAIRCDNGPEYISQTLGGWTNKHKITLLYIQPGKPTQNAYIERFNRTARHEWLDLHLFKSVEHAQLLVTQWLWIYNNERPHTAIGGVPPRQLLNAA